MLRWLQLPQLQLQLLKNHKKKRSTTLLASIYKSTTDIDENLPVADTQEGRLKITFARCFYGGMRVVLNWRLYVMHIKLQTNKFYFELYLLR